MRSRFSKLLTRSAFVLFASVAFTGAQCGGTPVETNSVLDSAPGTVPAAEQTKFLSLLNIERAKRGVGALSNNNTLQSVAAQYSGEVASTNQLAYTFAFNGQDAAQRVRSTGTDFNAIGHVGAVDFNNAQNLLNALILQNSFILSSDTYRQFGLGVANSAQHNYWTMIVID